MHTERTVVGRRCLILACAALAGVSCGSSTAPAPGGPTVRFSVDTLRLIEGEAQAIPFEVVGASGQTLAGQTPTFTAQSSDGAGITVAGSQATAAAGGTGTIVATLGAATARLPVLAFGHPAGTDVRSLPLSGRPYGVAIGPNFALVTQLDAGTVTRFSLNPFQIVATIPAGSVPTGISIDARATRALVTNQFDPSIGVIDVATNRQVATIGATSTTFRTIFSADGSRGYGTLSEGKLVVIDPASGASVSTVSIVQDGNGIAFGPGDTLLYVTSMLGGISVIDSKTNQAVRTIPINGELQDIAFTRDRTAFFVASETNSNVGVYSASTAGQTGSISAGGPTFGLGATPDGKQVWLAQTALGRIAIVDVATQTVVRTVDVGGLPRRVAFDRLGTQAVVSDEAGNVVLIH